MEKAKKMLIKIKTMPNIFPRAFLLLLFLFPFYDIAGFLNRFMAYLSGNILTEVIQNQWHVVVVSILIFLAFLIPLTYRRRAKWAEYGLVTAFFVSLFIEMYGIPLTILFASKFFFKEALLLPKHVISFSLFGVSFGMDLFMTYSLFIMFIGAFLILVGWLTLYLGTKKGKKLVKNGIYKYSRHPQYLGFILLIYGWLVGWPTILTLIMAPILIYKYVTVSLREEKDISKENASYEKYKKKTPFFI